QTASERIDDLPIEPARPMDDLEEARLIADEQAELRARGYGGTSARVEEVRDLAEEVAGIQLPYQRVFSEYVCCAGHDDIELVRVIAFPNHVYSGLELDLLQQGRKRLELVSRAIGEEGDALQKTGLGVAHEHPRHDPPRGK